MAMQNKNQLTSEFGLLFWNFNVNLFSCESCYTQLPIPGDEYINIMDKDPKDKKLCYIATQRMNRESIIRNRRKNLRDTVTVMTGIQYLEIYLGMNDSNWFIP